jgi:uncharacterized protein (TIGR03083 family)
MSDDAHTWKLIHAERAAMADTLASLTPEQWGQRSLCGDWTVQIAAGHILAGAEQTKGNFLRHMARNGFRFNRMIDRDARTAGALPRDEIIQRLRATTSTTNGPPAPVMTMLGEVMVHGEDILHPLGLSADHDPEAVTACLDMYKTTSFPVGTKKRIAGLRLAPDDVDWAHGDGPEVTGPARSMLLVMTGRSGALGDLSGEGVSALRSRMTAST